ncbi:hypothetical protein pah_c012o018 [Parachlamydia acanthamoebae str. Hall's coccus]|nr:hypothetical protein pah_c012o018 [Parachlamydia acanthamoebae str. Hall's coccus]
MWVESVFLLFMPTILKRKNPDCQQEFLFDKITGHYNERIG